MARPGALPEGSVALAKIRFGSHLYGTSTPESDVDWKVVFLPPGRDVLLGHTRQAFSEAREKAHGERNRPGDVDIDYLSLHFYLDKLTQGEPRAVDMIFAPDWAMQHRPHALWEELRNNRRRLLTRKSASFVSYCGQQANKYGIKGSRVHTLREVVAFLDRQIEKHGKNARLGAAREELLAWLEETRMPFCGIVRVQHLNGEEELFECVGKKTPFTSSITLARNMWANNLRSVGTRALAAEANQGIDWKAVSHAVRVGHQAIELMRTGRFTFPLPNAARILDIKLGRVPYEEVAAEIESLFPLVNEAAMASELPAEHDAAWADDFLAEAHALAVGAMAGPPARVNELRRRVDEAAAVLGAAPDVLFDRWDDATRKQASKISQAALTAWGILTDGRYPASVTRDREAANAGE